jgi:hypothetical protein
MNGFVGFSDAPRPWSMIVRSWVGVSCFATLVSAGTSGETPPRPWSPWHCEQAKPTKSCAPAATCGSIEPPLAATGAFVACRVAWPTAQPATAAAKARPTARRTIAASAVAGFQEPGRLIG